MKRSLEGQIDELYRLPLSEFTTARNTLAKSLSGDEKKTIAALAKPTLPMWVINQLHWEDAPTYRALIDAAEKLRATHRSALSGRNADTRKADELHRTTVDKAFAKALRIAEKHGIRVTDTVRDAIRRTVSALPGDEPAGRLTRAPEPAGFSLLTGIKVPASPKPRVVRMSREERERQRRAEQEKKEAERKAREEQAARDREIKKAEQALRDAERRLAELKG
jgi:hypothetical protein